MRPARLLLGLAVFCGLAFPALGQFGQNKITYLHFQWSVYRSPHFDLHYYKEEAQQLEELVSEAESAYLDLSRRLDHDVRFRIPLIVYSTHIEFEQTNIAMEEIPEAVGGFSEPFQNRIVIPIDSPPDKRYQLIRHELTHIFEFDIFYAGSLRRALAAGPPLWLTEGLASYLADDEDSFDQMVIRDAVVNNLVPSVRQLNVFSFLTYRYGHAIFDFIEARYGAAGLRTFLFEFRKVLLTPVPEKAFQDAFGLSVDGFDRAFARYLRQRYLPVLTEKRAPEDYGHEIGLTKPGRFTLSPALSPSGDLVAALATPGAELDVVILSAKDGKVIRNLTHGFTNAYDEVVTEAFSGKRDLAWSPGGDRLAFFVRKENYRQLMIYGVPGGRLERQIPFKDIADCASPAFSPDGETVAFSGNQGGYWDIFTYNLRTAEVRNLTQDEYYDGNPSWSADGSAVLYNRRIGEFAKIFTVSVGAPERKAELTSGAASDIEPAYSKDGKWVYFSSDRGAFGVFNLHRLEIQSGRVERLTDLVGGAFTPAEMAPAEDGSPQLAYSAFYAGVFRLYKMRVGGAEVERASKVGREEPSTSPLAPSRRAEMEAERKARAAGAAAGEPAGEAPPGAKPGAKPETGPGEAPGAAPPGPKPPPPPAPQPELEPSPLTQPTPGAPQPAPPPSGAAAGAAPGEAPEGAKPGPSEDADLKPFRAPLQLGLDSSRYGPYHAKFDLDVPYIMVGLADDGTFLSEVIINFTDLLGDQRIAVRASSVSGYSNIEVAYANLKRRLDWGVAVQDYRDYYLTTDSAGQVAATQRRERFTAATFFAAYPFSRRWRTEASVGYMERRLDYPQYQLADPNNPDSPVVLGFQTFSDNLATGSVALVNDTTRFQSWGPWQGRRWRLEYAHARFVGGDSSGETVNAVSLDFRGYQRLTRRSLVAFRVAGARQTGERAGIYSLGGINQLRGYNFREFIGPNVVWANLELRFPLIDEVDWAFGLRVGPVRGFLFADFGTAWFEDTLHFNCTEPAPGTLQCDPNLVRGKASYDGRFGILRNYRSRDEQGRWVDIHGSAGLGFHVPVLGLPLAWSFAKIYDGESLGPYSSSFYIVFDW